MRYKPRFPRTPWEIVKIHDFSLIFMEDFHDFPRCLGKSECISHPTPQNVCRPIANGREVFIHCVAEPRRPSPQEYGGVADPKGSRLAKSVSQTPSGHPKVSQTLPKALQCVSCTSRGRDVLLYPDGATFYNPAQGSRDAATSLAMHQVWSPLERGTHGKTQQK